MASEEPVASLDGVRSLAAAIRDLPCPVCQGRDRPLDAAQVSWIESYWGFVCVQHWSIVVGCEPCLRRAASVTLDWTLRRGFWSLLGLLLAPLAIWRSLTLRRLRVGASPSQWLLAFVAQYDAPTRAAIDERQPSHLLVGVEPALLAVCRPPREGA